MFAVEMTNRHKQLIALVLTVLWFCAVLFWSRWYWGWRVFMFRRLLTVVAYSLPAVAMSSIAFWWYSKPSTE